MIRAMNKQQISAQFAPKIAPYISASNHFDIHMYVCVCVRQENKGPNEMRWQKNVRVTEDDITEHKHSVYTIIRWVEHLFYLPTV